MIYLDNSATTNKKPKEVINAVNLGLTKYSANPGRSGHKLSLITAEKINEVREDVASFINANGGEKVIFTQNCTDALNLAILGTVQKGAHVITTINEHNSVLRPLFELKDKLGIEITLVEPKKNASKIEVSDIEPHIKSNTQLIFVNHISNVDGMQADIKSIGELCASECILFGVDGAQSCGHIPIDMAKQHIDLLALAPHKGLYAPQGVGVLCYSAKSKLKPIRYGGTGTDSTSVLQPTSAPECYESGTLSTPNILGLGAGLKFVKTNFYKIKEKLDDLTTYLNFELNKIKNVKVYTHPDNAFGVLSFNVGDAFSSDISEILDQKYSICTRSGLHCAPLKHKYLGTLEQGTVRISLSFYNTFNEIETFLKVMKTISKDF